MPAGHVAAIVSLKSSPSPARLAFPLRLSTPALHDLAEADAWEGVCRAAGIEPQGGRARREENRS